MVFGNKAGGLVSPINPYLFYFFGNRPRKLREMRLSRTPKGHMTATKVMDVAEIRQVVIGDGVFSEKANYT